MLLALPVLFLHVFALLLTFSHGLNTQVSFDSKMSKIPGMGTPEYLDSVEDRLQVKNKANFIRMPIDHFMNKTTATFLNRYWVNATYWKQGGPVFLFDSGEQNAELLLPYYLQEYHGLSAVMRLAKKSKDSQFSGNTGFMAPPCLFP
jgi:hypothetical protein